MTISVMVKKIQLLISCLQEVDISALAVFFVPQTLKGMAPARAHSDNKLILLLMVASWRAAIG